MGDFCVENLKKIRKYGIIDVLITGGCSAMWIRSLFHKIKMFCLRCRGASIPSVDTAKKYGNDGEDRFINSLYQELPLCEIKRNVIIATDDGNAEIDCLVLYQDKLFAIELKCWNGHLVERENDFLKITVNPRTGEKKYELHKSPFKQLGRAIYLLKKQIPIKVWINAVVFFEDDGLESVSVISDDVWFSNYSDLANYIRNEGEISSKAGANKFFEKCVSADCIYAENGYDSLNCIVNPISLRFDVLEDRFPVDQVVSIHIRHHWYYDELYVKLVDGRENVIISENAKIQVTYNGRVRVYALCKMDCIILGNR